MSDIFICYSRKDLAVAEQFVQQFHQEGWNVFIDRQTQVGRRWHKEIESELHVTRAVVVLWSSTSRDSDFVLEEAEYGKRKNILFPAFIEHVEFPYGFSRIQTADLSNWNGNPSHPDWVALLRSLQLHLNDHEKIVTNSGLNELNQADISSGHSPKSIPTGNGGKSKQDFFIRKYLLGFVLILLGFGISFGMEFFSGQPSNFGIQIPQSRKKDPETDKESISTIQKETKAITTNTIPRSESLKLENNQLLNKKVFPENKDAISNNEHALIQQDKTAQNSTSHPDIVFPILIDSFETDKQNETFQKEVSESEKRNLVFSEKYLNNMSRATDEIQETQVSQIPLPSKKTLAPLGTKIDEALNKTHNSKLFPELVPFPAGSFYMGRSEATFIPKDYSRYSRHDPKVVEEWKADEKARDGVPGKTVQIKTPFLLGQKPVTYQQFNHFVKIQQRKGIKVIFPTIKRTDNGSATGIHWEDANAYAQWMGKQIQLKCRLSTEAEWEYARKLYATKKTKEKNNIVSENSELQIIYDKDLVEWVCSYWGPKFLGQEQKCASYPDRNGEYRALRYVSTTTGRAYERTHSDPEIGFRVLCLPAPE